MNNNELYLCMQRWDDERFQATGAEVGDSIFNMTGLIFITKHFINNFLMDVLLLLFN